MSKDIRDFIDKIKNIDNSLNESKYTDNALDKIKEVGGFENLPDIDKLALLTDADNEEELKKLNLIDIYKENDGTFGYLEIKVKVKDEKNQPVDHKFSKEHAGEEGWLFPGIHYSDNNEPYVTVRFDSFTPNQKLKGGGQYDDYPIMLRNIYPIGYDEIKSEFADYDKKVKSERKEFLNRMRDLGLFDDDL